MRYITFSVPTQAFGMTLKQLLRDHFRLSKKQVHLLRMHKNHKRNDEDILFHEVLQVGDCIQIAVVEPAISYSPCEIQIEVLYEDAHVLVVNKPKHMKVHPNTSAERHTLCNGVAYYLTQKGEENDVRYVHRLDEDTTGAVIFAKHTYAHTLLDRQLFERNIHRHYGAICHRPFQQLKGKIDAPLGKNRMGKRCVQSRGVAANTNYQVFRQNEMYAYAQFELKTGRTHQIRIHCAYIGHPIVGDTLYGGKKVKGFDSQALHAFSLSFFHPFDGQLIQVACPFPPVLQEMIDTLPKVGNVNKYEKK